MKLLIFTPCDRVIQDPLLGASLISVFHGIAVKALPETELPEDAVIPKEWAVFSKWELQPDEVGKDYTCHLKIFWPNGTEFASQSLNAIQPARDGMAFVYRMMGFPIGQAGPIKLVMELESLGSTVFGPVEMEIKINDATYIFSLPFEGQ